MGLRVTPLLPRWSSWEAAQELAFLLSSGPFHPGT